MTISNFCIASGLPHPVPSWETLTQWIVVDKAMVLPSRFLFGNVGLFKSELFEEMHLFCK